MKRPQKRPTKQRKSPRSLRLESLEGRSLLAGISGLSLWQNPEWAVDLDANGTVGPSDALVAVNALNQGLGGTFAGSFAPPGFGHHRGPGGPGGPGGQMGLADSLFLDSNGDSQLSPLDALMVINCLNNGDSSSPPSTDTSTDQQVDQIGADATTLDLTNGATRVHSAINADGDKDVFQVTADKSQLNVAIFTRSGAELTVAVTDDSGTEVGSATTTADARHSHVSVDVAVAAGANYYIVISGAAGDTGKYSVQVVNYDPVDVGDDDSTDDSTTDSSSTDGSSTDDSSTDDSSSTTDSNASAESEGTDGSTDSSSSTDTTDSTTTDSTTTTTSTDGTTTTSTDGTTTTNAGTDSTSDPPCVPPDGTAAGLPTPEELFAKIDSNGDGSITADELAALPGVTASADTIANFVTKLDADNSGGISIDEIGVGLLVRLNNIALPRPEEHGGSRPGGPEFEGHDHGHHGGPGSTPTPQQLFAKLDADTSSTLSLDEFKSFRLPPPLAAQIDKIFAALDADGDGFLSLAEFLGPEQVA